MDKKYSAVALGIFDGVHLGHRAVINAALSQRSNGLTGSVFTFEPECVLRKPGGSAGYIYTSAEKDMLLKENIGIENVYSPAFDELCGLSGEEFASEILKKRMDAAYVCCGADFRFGKNASCGAEELEKFGRRFGFETEIVKKVESDGAPVSSSRIRELLLSGGVDKANKLLGWNYFMYSAVADGNHIGRTIDFPTINQNFADGQLVPAYGVYSSFTNIGGKIMQSITNIGVKPTIEGERRPLAETHIIGFSGDLYGQILNVSISRFIRPEMKFSSVDELKEQIKCDIDAVCG